MQAGKQKEKKELHMCLVSRENLPDYIQADDAGIQYQQGALV